MKVTPIAKLPVAVILLSLYFCSASHGQTVAAGAPYFPLKHGVTYYYKVSFNGLEQVDGIQATEITTSKGEKIFYFENVTKPSILIGYNTFGLGAFYIEKGDVYAIAAHWMDDLGKINTEQKQLLIPKIMDAGQGLPLIPPGSDPVYTFNFEGFDDIRVPAGDFDKCLKFRMTASFKSGTEETAYIWLAKDIGMVRHQRSTGRIEELLKRSNKKLTVPPALPSVSMAATPVHQELQKPVEQPVAIPIEQAPELATVSDFEGNIYKTVKIGDQVWMAENLRSTKYADGAPIVDSLSANTEYLKEAATFGRLYSWHALLRGKTLDGAEGVCPSGWHVPMKTEWETLIQFAGGAAIAGQKLKSKGTRYFKAPNTGTDEYGFNALPCGIYAPHTGFSKAWHRAHFWTSTIDNQYAGPGEYCVGFFYEIWHDADKVDEMFNMPGNYHPVRCIKN